ncbi:hypothetical protein [Rhodococcus sp. X156]|uniref:hypothetical protein n=1 Tax=Rhodococcus sp. X156 TaxID=2499145 RepID=UPI000FDBDDD6|nr:hypothetical protein [Rhodococcus sp. X156]
MPNSPLPDYVPVLSRGRHRKPSKGACFMELASFLAGERWSDHPGCTHPLLAALARDVNDQVRDEARQQLSTMIPDVIGLNDTDPRIDAWLAREVSLTALPLVSAERQCVAVVGLLHCERVLDTIEGRPLDYLSPEVTAAMAAYPDAQDWALRFCSLGWGRQDRFDRRSAPAIIHSCVVGIAGAKKIDADAVLVDLLRRSIADCRRWMHHEPQPVTDAQWRQVAERTSR